MKLLAIDTSGKSGSIAVINDGRLLKQTDTGDVGTHSEWLLKNISELLQSLSINSKDIDAYAITAGPGSFTGLRIGISALKGLAWANKKDVFTVSTLESLAMNFETDGLICPLLDARKKELYCALFSKDGDVLKRLMPDSALSVEALIKELDARGEGRYVTFIGSGLVVYKEYIEKNFKRASFATEHQWNIRAHNIGTLALSGKGEKYNALELAPVYLRKSEAELNRQ